MKKTWLVIKCPQCGKNWSHYKPTKKTSGHTLCGMSGTKEPVTGHGCGHIYIVDYAAKTSRHMIEKEKQILRDPSHMEIARAAQAKVIAHYWG